MTMFYSVMLFQVVIFCVLEDLSYSINAELTLDGHGSGTMEAAFSFALFVTLISMGSTTLHAVVIKDKRKRQKQAQ